MAEPKKKERSPVSRHLRGEDDKHEEVKKLDDYFKKNQPKGVITDVEKFKRTMQRLHGDNAKRVVEMYKVWREDAAAKGLPPERVKAYENELIELMKDVRDSRDDFDDETSDDLDTLKAAIDKARAAYAKIKDDYENDPSNDIEYDDVEKAEVRVIRLLNKLRDVERAVAEKAKADEAKIRDFAEEQAAAQEVKEKPAADLKPEAFHRVYEESVAQFDTLLSEYIPNDKMVESALAGAVKPSMTIAKAIADVAATYRGNTKMSILALGQFMLEPYKVFSAAMSDNDTRTADWRDVLKSLNPMTPKQDKQVLKDAQNYVAAQKAITKHRATLLRSIITSGKYHDVLKKAVVEYGKILDTLAAIGKDHASDYPMLQVALKAYVDAGQRDAALYKKVLG